MVRETGWDTAPLPWGFSALTREWFTSAFAQPTRAQEGAWSAIHEGKHTLVVAPTGSGKTLAAFLAAIDSPAKRLPSSNQKPDTVPGALRLP